MVEDYLKSVSNHVFSTTLSYNLTKQKLLNIAEKSSVKYSNATKSQFSSAS